jgi:DNA-binding MarR family transcriptional regulator
MSRTPPDVGRNAWYQSLRAHTAVMEIFERELMEQTGMSVAWYDVLVCLYKSPDHAMRMSELADRVIMSRSWLTRRVDQLVEVGLVERCGATGDGRGVQARLTRQGKRVFIQLQRSHGASIDAHFATLLEPDEAEVVARAMEKIANASRTTLGLTL